MARAIGLHSHALNIELYLATTASRYSSDDESVDVSRV